MTGQEQAHVCSSERCCNCDTRLNDHSRFGHLDHGFCCECMASLVSWFLDRGVVEDPELFAWVEAGRG